MNVSWEGHKELDLLGYVVFVHVETVTDTFVGPDGTYLTEKEKRFPLFFFPVNQYHDVIMHAQPLLF